MFRGHFPHTLDSKGRVSLPSRFREVLTAEGDSRFVLTPSPFDPCLHLYPMRAWEEFERKVDALPSLDRTTTLFRRLYVSAAVECELDSAGRVLVPPGLRQHARLEKDVMWAGMGRKLELWSKQDFENTLKASLEDQEALRRAMEQLQL